MPFLPQLDRFAEALADQLEKRRVWFLVSFSIVYLVSTCLLAERKLMWNDELFTFYTSRLSSISDIWSLLSTGADQIPPFFHIVTRASFSLFGVNHFSIRLPEVLGYWVMSLCLYRFVSKRSSALPGFVAMLFPLITGAYYYAYEARPYGLVLGFCGLALVCWQSASEGRFRKLSLIGLTVSLAAAVSSHYYAVLLFFPLALGELVRSRSPRRLDLPVWLAFGFAMTPLILFLPLIERSRIYSATFWSKPHWGAIPESYYFLLKTALLPLVATLIFSAVYSTTRPVIRPGREREPRPAPPAYEIAAAFGFVAIPIIAVILAMAVTGAFTDRYSLPSVIGFSILLAFAAYRLLDGRAIMGVTLVLSFCGGFMTLQARNFQSMSALARAEVDTYRFLQFEGKGDLPIVASDGHRFMMLARYAPPDITSRLVYLADPRAALRHLGHNTLDQGMLDLKPWFGLRVEEYAPYVASQRQFLVYTNAKFLEWNWLLSELKTTDVQIELRGRKGDDLLFLVSPKGQSGDPQGRGVTPEPPSHVTSK